VEERHTVRRFGKAAWTVCKLHSRKPDFLLEQIIRSGVPQTPEVGDAPL
jgi:hypothetical protein